MIKDQMKSLCAEIRAMRSARGGMMNEMRHEAGELKKTVGDLCSHFGRARTAMAKRTKQERVAFLNTLKRSVGTQRRDLQKDLAGARKAWAGIRG
jgi:hypothetical protein